jgi:hypothetical protein
MVPTMPVGYATLLLPRSPLELQTKLQHKFCETLQQLPMIDSSTCVLVQMRVD